MKVTVGQGKGNNDKNKVYLIPMMYSKLTETHQYLQPSSCHSPQITENLPSIVMNRIRRNCSDNVENDQIFKDTLIEYKAYLMKSGYKEEHIDSIFVPFSVQKKRSQLLFPLLKEIRKRQTRTLENTEW